LQLALNLQRQFPGRGDGQRQGRPCGREVFDITEQGGCQGKAEGNGLARASLGRHKKIGILHLSGEDRFLNRGKGIVAAIVQRLPKRRMDVFKFCHCLLSGCRQCRDSRHLPIKDVTLIQGADDGDGIIVSN
jgi:hypothetical protein